MNILVYNSQKPEDVCPKIAEIVAKELRISDIAYEVEMPDSPEITNAKTVLGDIARTVFGGKTDNLFTVIFKPDKPRPFEIRVSVIGQARAVPPATCCIPLIWIRTWTRKRYWVNPKYSEPPSFQEERRRRSSTRMRT